MGSSETEICSNCGRHIASSEMAYVVDDKIICPECDLKLSEKGEHIQISEDNRSDNQDNAKKDTDDQLAKSEQDKKSSGRHSLMRIVLTGFAWYVFGILIFATAIWIFGTSSMKSIDVFAIGFLIICGGWCFRMGTFYFKIGANVLKARGKTN